MKARGQPKRNEDIAKLSANEGSRKFISSNKTNNHEDLKKHQPRRSNRKKKERRRISLSLGVEQGLGSS